VEYFYREAIRQQENGEEGTAELETSFRYPGPKPQTKEIAAVMLSDAAESASRALSEPTPASLAKLLHELVLKRLLDGQFEECGLTLTELHRLEESLRKSLIALYHARIRYPELKNRAS
jgi:membrane-associated HD superfamily phosphohydrolase